jgi:hypothetical protein
MIWLPNDREHCSFSKSGGSGEFVSASAHKLPAFLGVCNGPGLAVDIRADGCQCYFYRQVQWSGIPTVLTLAQRIGYHLKQIPGPHQVQVDWQVRPALLAGFPGFAQRKYALGNTRLDPGHRDNGIVLWAVLDRIP